MSDTFVLVGVSLLFALAVTMHVAIAVGLAHRSPGWHGPVAFVVAPLAPYWALRSHMPVRGATWLLAVFGYAALRALSPR